jgi:C_GCAxxG_C_C family probable redox protein
MARIEAAVSRFKEGCNCSQAILATYGEALGLERETALRLACGFGGGMRLGDTCGAVTGALMVIGLKYGPQTCPGQPAKAETYRLVQEFTARFANSRGSVMCRDLLGCDISTPEGLQRAQTDQLFVTVCPEMVRTAAEILEEMLGLPA